MWSLISVDDLLKSRDTARAKSEATVAGATTTGNVGAYPVPIGQPLTWPSVSGATSVSPAEVTPADKRKNRGFRTLTPQWP